MWKRLKYANPISQPLRKRSAEPSSHAHSNDVPSLPLSKKARPSKSSSITTDKNPKMKPSKRSSKHASLVSSTQRRLDTYLVPTAIPTLAPTQQAPTGYPPPAIRGKRTGTQGQRRPKPAKHIHGAHEAGVSTGTDAAGDGGNAAASSSHSSCPDVTCVCPDMMYHDVSALHDSDVFPATIRSTENLFCPLALPSSTNSKGCPLSKRRVSLLKLRDTNSLGSSSRLRQSSLPIVCSSITILDGNPPVIVPSSSSLEYDKGIAFS